MPLFAGRSQGDAHAILTHFGVPHAYAPLANAEAEPGQELRVLSTTPGTAIWLTYNQPAFGRHDYTVDVCTQHDDDNGCCDMCGRWVSEEAYQADLAAARQEIAANPDPEPGLSMGGPR